MQKQGVNISANPTASTTVDLPDNFRIQLRAVTDERNFDLTVRYFRSTSVNASAPQFRINNHTVLSSKEKNIYVVGKDSNFDPTDVKPLSGSNLKFTAQQSETDTKTANITVVSNPVDTSKGNQLYTITLRATNSAGQTTDLSYQVFVLASTKQVLASDAPTYSFDGGLKERSESFKAGTSIYISSYQIRKSGNDVYILASPSSQAAVEGPNLDTWINVDSLSGSEDYNTTGQEATVMVASRAYDKNGKFTGKTYPVYSQISYLPTVHQINGKTYYKVLGKDEYVRVTNITGTPRVLTHNAYVYRSSYRRSKGYPKFYKNEKVITYGAAVKFKNGKKYYKISGCTATNKRYIKAVNFR